MARRTLCHIRTTPWLRAGCASEPCLGSPPPAWLPWDRHLPPGSIARLPGHGRDNSTCLSAHTVDIPSQQLPLSWRTTGVHLNNKHKNMVPTMLELLCHTMCCCALCAACRYCLSAAMCRATLPPLRYMPLPAPSTIYAPYYRTLHCACPLHFSLCLR